MSLSPSRLTALCAGAVCAGSLALLGGALAFEHFGGLAPCGLCLPQRGPHAAVIVMAGWALICAPLAPGAARLALAAAFPVLLLSVGLGLHHVGVEQHWWAGPAACGGGSATLPGNAADFAASLRASSIVRCDAVTWQMFGLSLAGYNALVSALLAALSAAPALAYFRKERAP